MRAIVTGDIGCYTLGALPPLSAMDTTVDMGASVSMAHGFELALAGTEHRPIVAVIGDSTFAHSGLSSLISMVYNRGVGTVCVLDNRTTAMNLLAATDAFTTGSGLLVRGLADPRVVTVPLAGQGAIRLGWIQARDTRLTPQAEYFVALLEQSVQDSIAYTRELHRSLHGDGA